MVISESIAKKYFPRIDLLALEFSGRQFNVWAGNFLAHSLTKNWWFRLQCNYWDKLSGTSRQELRELLIQIN
ncbi:MAG: hypothetical protein ACI845_002400 [Gammaproteobacteria bacterium]|jgi:hypothetical protein